MLEIYADLYKNGKKFDCVNLECDLLKSDMDQIFIPDEIELKTKHKSIMIFRLMDEFDFEKARELAKEKREPDWNVFERASLATKINLRYEFIYSKLSVKTDNVWYPYKKVKEDG